MKKQYALPIKYPVNAFLITRLPCNLFLYYIDVDYSSSRNIMTNKFNQLLELNFATHFWLRCVWKTPDFIRPLIGHVINDEEDVWSPHPMRATAESEVLPSCLGLAVQLVPRWLPGRPSRPSTNEAQNSAVYNHYKASNHSFKPEEVVILEQTKHRTLQITITAKLPITLLNLRRLSS